MQHLPGIHSSRLAKVAGVIICKAHHIITGLDKVVDVPVGHTEKITSAPAAFHLAAPVEKTAFEIPERNIRTGEQLLNFPQQSFPVVYGKLCIGRIVRAEHHVARTCYGDPFFRLRPIFACKPLCRQTAEGTQNKRYIIS